MRNMGKGFNIAQELNGLPVVELERQQRLGQIVDVIVHPTEGFVLGFVLVNAAGEERILAVNDCLVYPAQGVVMVTPDAWDDMQQIQATFSRGVRACEKLLNVEVVTQSGKLLGRVVEIYVTEVELRTIYRVVTSRLRLFIGGGVFIPGDLPLAWVEKGARLIVPADAMERESFSSLAESLKYV